MDNFVNLLFRDFNGIFPMTEYINASVIGR
jgi:hypothetical protein